MKSKLFVAFYILVQCTWGILQTMAGFCIFLANLKCPHHFFRGCIVTTWKSNSSLSLGMFIFVTENPFHFYPERQKEISLEEFYTQYEVHEYGHTIQSLIFGPLYLIVVGITSVTWALHPHFVKKRATENLSYFEVFPESHANFLGEKVTGLKSPGKIK